MITEALLAAAIICALPQQREQAPGVKPVSVTLESRVSVWSAPGPLSQRVTILESGTSLTVVAYRPGEKYFQVRFKDTTGYVDARDLKRTEALDRLVAEAAGTGPKEPKDRASKPETAEQTAKRQLLTLLYGERIASRIMQKKVWKGMTKQMVIQSLGEPKSVKKTSFSNVVKEQWEYEDGTLLFFDNDVLTAYGGPPREFTLPSGLQMQVQP